MAIFLKYLYFRSLEAFIKSEHLFPPYANPDLLEGRETIAPQIVEEVANFVMNFEGQDTGALLHGEHLSEALFEHADMLIEKVEGMKASLKDMDYHQGRHYRVDIGRSFFDFADKCASALEFCCTESHTTHQSPISLRRVFAHYGCEMRTTLPKILDRMALTDQAYNVRDMTVFRMAIAF